jgi:hypothetical protein
VMKSSRVILGCLVIALFATTASAAWEPITDKIPLPSLPGGSLVVGDKEFSGFNLDIITVDGGATIPDPNTMTVQGVRDVGTGDYGLRFNGYSWSVSSGQIITVDLSFKVSILDEPEYDDYFIKDIWLYLTGVGATGTGVVSAGENVWTDFPGGTQIASLTCSCDANNVKLSAYAEFAPLKEIYIQTKHISVSGGTNGTAHFSEFFQFYSQVPEPATITLLGLAGAIVLRRRRR